MKTVVVNGVETHIQSEELLFSEFIKELGQNLNKERQVISNIRIDGVELDERSEGSYATKAISQLGTVEIETASPADLAYQTLDTLDVYTDRLIASIERASSHYRNKNLVSGDAYFTKAIDGLDLFVQTISGVKMALRIGLNPKLALTEAALVSIMNDLLDAKRSNNYVYLSQLLQTDLVENLIEWKTVVFPLFRNWNVT